MRADDDCQGWEVRGVLDEDQCSLCRLTDTVLMDLVCASDTRTARPSGARRRRGGGSGLRGGISSAESK